MKTPESGKDTNVLRKTPEEIKKGLEGCGGLDGDCENCPYDEQTIYCNDRLMRDALAYIQQLEAGIDHAEKVARECAKSITENLDKLQAKLIQVERERDAAVDSLRGECFECVWHESMCDKCASCVHSADAWNVNVDNWEWRGVCPEAPKEE